MFRMSLLSCVVLAVVAQGSFAQDKKRESTILKSTPWPNPSAPSLPFPSSVPKPVQTLPSVVDEAPEAESGVPKVEDKKDEWAPAMRVFLNEAFGVQTVAQYKTVIRKVPVTRYKPTQKNGKVIHVPVTTMQEVSQVVRSVTAGTTIIDCDDVNVQVSTSEEGPKVFEFEIKGKLRLQNGSTLIEAKSAKLVDGKLTLTDVTLNTDSMKMTCTELVLDLKVRTLRVGEVTEPTLTPTPLTPIPSPGRGGAPSLGFSPLSSNSSFSAPMPTPASTFSGPIYNNSGSTVRKKTTKGQFRSQ